MMTPMPGSTSLRLIATRQQRNIVDRLWQLYRHDLSEFRGYMPDSEGLYEPGRLPTFFEDPDRCGYLIYSGQALAGFALIRGLSQEPKVVGEFFVVLATRGDRHSRGNVQRRAAAGTGGTGDTTGHLAASEHRLTNQQVVPCTRPTSRLTRTKTVFRRPLQSSSG